MTRLILLVILYVMTGVIAQGESAFSDSLGILLTVVTF